MIDLSKINRFFFSLLLPFFIYSISLFSQPIVSNISPVSGSILGGNTVTISGSGFTGATEVDFGALVLSTTDFTVVNDNTITANIPASSPPTTPPTSIPIVVDVRVVSPSGISTTNQDDRYAFTNGDWYAYLPDFGSANVYTSNITTKLVNPTPITTGDGPNDVSMTFDGSTAYVVNSNSNTISVIDIRTMTVTNTIPTASSFPILISTSLNTLSGDYIGYTADYLSNTVTQINLTTGTVLNTIPVGTNPTGGILNSAYDPTLLYVVNSGSSNITRIDLSNFSTTTIDTGAGSIPSFIALAPDGSTAYFADDGTNTVRQLLNINSATPVLGANISDPNFNFSGVNLFPQIAISSPSPTSPNSYAYITNTGSNTVSIIDITNIASPTVICTIQVESGPNGAAITPDGTTLYVCNANSNVVTIASNLPNCSPTVVDQLIGSTPTDPAITPDQAPLAYFMASPTIAGIGDAITFDGTLSASPVGTIASYDWDFGDGNTATGAAVSHSYSLAGNYTVTLTVTNSAGTSVASSSFYNGQSLLKNGGDTALYTKDILISPAANFPTTTTLTTTPNPSNLNQTVTFDATVTSTVGTPTGTIQFTVDGVAFGNPIVLVNGQASITDSFSLAGNYSIGAFYIPSIVSIFNSSSAIPVTQVVNPDSSTTTLAITPNSPVVYGQTLTFTATVAPGTTTSGDPTGTVQFIYANNATFFPVIFGTATLSTTGGVTTATITVNNLPADNSYQFYASYQGDTNHTPSDSTPQNYVINIDSTNTIVFANPNPSVYGQSVTFTATVSANAPGSGIPTGTVNFTDTTTGIFLGSAVLDSNGQAFFTTLTNNPLSVGSHIISAAYTGDGNFDVSNSTVTQIVNQASTTTTLSSNINPSFYGELVTFSAVVTPIAPGSGTPTGNVAFFVDGNPLGVVALNSSGIASIATPSLATGTHTVQAFYVGDTNFTNSDSNIINQLVLADGTTTALTSNINPSVFGQTITLTATVSPINTTTLIPTGTVTFFDDTTPIGTSTLDSTGTAVLSISTLTVGTHPITAQYSGDANFTDSTSSVVNQVVQQAETSTTLSSSINPSVFGQPVTFTAVVTAIAPGSGIPTGTVTFFDGVTTIGTGTLDGTGTAIFTTPDLSVGTHSITAQYNGDINFIISTSSVVNQVVQQAETLTTLASNINPSVFGQPVTFTSVVTAIAPGSGIPTGTVTFFDGTTPIGTSTLDSTGTTTLTISNLSVGTHSITAQYNGDINFIGSLSPVVNQVVQQAETSTSLSSNINPSVFGQPVTFTSVVAAIAPGSGIPTGTVTFFDNITPIGTSTLDSTGTATLSLSNLTVGTHPITAQYNGDTNFIGSISPVVNQLVQQDTTNTVVISSQNPSQLNDSVTFTAVISANLPGSGTPTGNVEFIIDGGAPIIVPLVNGQANLSSIFTTTGNHTIEANYLGDVNFLPSTGSLIQIVQGVTNTTLTISPPSPSVVGSLVTFTATVESNSTFQPTGDVQFYVDGIAYGSPVSLVNGVASLSTSTLPVGTHIIVANYLGDDHHASSISTPITYVIVQSTSSTVLTSSVNPAAFGQTVTFMATVNSPPASGIPTGTITFVIDGVATNPVTLVNGQAIFSTASLSIGSHTIVAIYSGDINHPSSVSETLIEIITAIPSPRHVEGHRTKNEFLTQTDYINVITWKVPNTGITPVAYQIYRDQNLTELAAVIHANEDNAEGKFKFKDHNRRKHQTYHYYLVSVNAFGAFSTPIEIVIKGEK